jgi:hypothetical protein
MENESIGNESLLIDRNIRRNNQVRMDKKPKLITLLLVIFMITGLCGQNAFASDSKNSAGTLNRLGLFLGTDAGYELEKQVTRAQAAVMMVRLLGKEKEALSGSYSHPFTDVPGWADKYIAYMYRFGLASGVSDKTFDPDGLCNLQMYSTFVLRALGYKEGSDFTYGSANDETGKLGLLATISNRDIFLRGDMVDVSYNVLAVKVKDSDNTLLDRLAAEGAVDTEVAKSVQNVFETSEQTNNGLKDVRIKLTFNNEEFTVKMYDNPTSRDFLSRLPLTLTFKEFGGFEKLTILDKELSTEDAPPGDDPEVGDFGYYAPWKDVNMYYKDWSYSGGLVKLGKIESDPEELTKKLQAIHDDFTVTIQKIN